MKVVPVMRTRGQGGGAGEAMATDGGVVPRGSRARSLAVPLAAAAAVALAAAYVGAVDPGEPGHYPPCPFLALTGLYCPGCGGLRAVHALVHGDPASALGFNPFVVALVPVAALVWGRWVLLSWRGRPFAMKSVQANYVWSFLALMILFWILRNVPFGEFLAP
ncbi:DUF2752 domain-containing protein [Streptosporangium pseudovulgare]|uniref:DUF2752 domain-containing protein n=1 Tax=Streptosporangium pseudovulgare TaxID=35765 RepID=A0ABQ2QFD4_9ACTN|nr:DUF2752 domain-containing protein [Streptosporangium pseudovulgare]GGP76760.1 hypothetical protein GCM10010140_00710 [Streptosporangium pseudovulgare]